MREYGINSHSDWISDVLTSSSCFNAFLGFGDTCLKLFGGWSGVKAEASYGLTVMVEVEDAVNQVGFC